MLGICHYNNGKYTLFNIKTAHKNKSPKNIIYLHLNFGIVVFSILSK